MSKLKSTFPTWEGGNYLDNMNQVNQMASHLLVELTEKDFRNLIFLENDDVAKIMPRGSDRRLEVVAQRALCLPETEWYLGENWDLGIVWDKTRAWLASENRPFPPLLLRDARGAN